MTAKNPTPVEITPNIPNDKPVLIDQLIDGDLEYSPSEIKKSTANITAAILTIPFNPDENSFSNLVAKYPTPKTSNPNPMIEIPVPISHFKFGDFA